MSKPSKSVQLYNILKNQIITGKRLAGSKFPPEIELCEEFGISRQTVRQAIVRLKEEKLVETIKGSGTYVLERKNENPVSDMTIGLVATYVDDYIFPRLIGGIDDALTQRGYRMQLSITHNSVSMEKQQLLSLMNQRPAGILIEPAKSALIWSNREIFESIQNLKIPCVMMNGKIPGLSVPMVSINDKESGRKAAQYLLACGHRRIGACMKEDDWAGQMRYLGYREVLNEYGADNVDGNTVWYHTEDIESMFGKAADPYILKQFEGCTAIVCFNDLIAMKLYQLFERNGISIPEDISIIGHDDFQLGELVKPKLTTIHHPIEAVGRKAAECLLQIVQGDEKPEDCLLNGEVIVRDSVKYQKEDTDS